VFQPVVPVAPSRPHHELIRWSARRSAQIAVCLTDLERGYVTAADDGNLKFAPDFPSGHGRG
jgi:hypothetical protein